MNVNKLIIDTLGSLGVPVEFQTYGGEKDTYITFFEYLQQGEQYADDEEQTTGHYIQVDIYSKANYNKVAEQVKKLLKGKKFIRKYEKELYESDTNIYHKLIRFFCFTENEEE